LLSGALSSAEVCFAEQNVPVLSLPKYRSKPLNIISVQFLRNHGSTRLTTTLDDRVRVFLDSPSIEPYFELIFKENVLQIEAPTSGFFRKSSVGGAKPNISGLRKKGQKKIHLPFPRQ
jgi:hypothetical protein